MKPVLIAVSAAAAVLLAACGGNTATSTPSTGGPAGAPAPPSASLTGAGATFPAPFYSAAFYAYNLKFNQVTVNYQSVGSGAGIQQLTKKTVDFGASDVPMSATELTAAGGADNVVQIATTLGTESLAYNLQGVSSGQLKLTPDTIAGIFLGKIKKWNDAALAADNGGVSLPNQAITVVHRSDGSGTTYQFTDYLAKVSSDWKSGPGVGKSVSWPVGIGASGNTAVAQAVKSTDNAIGYVELAYVVQTHMQQAYLKNSAGKYLQASIAGATAAASKNTNVSPTNFSITNMDGDAAYPIASFSWIFLKKSIADSAKGRALVYLFKWVVTDGQSYGTPLDYAPLPAQVQTYALDQLKTVSVAGTIVLK